MSQGALALTPAGAEAPATAPEALVIPINGYVGPPSPFSDNDDYMDLTKLQRILGGAKDVQTIRAVINSPGGSIFEGFAIFAELDLHPASVEVEIRGIAASIAAVIAMAADPGKIRIHKLGRMMIHEGRAGVFGTKRDAADMSEMLASLDAGIVSAFSKHFTWSDAEILAAMEATTWLTAKEAKKAGAVAEIMDGPDAVNRLDLSPLAEFGIPEDVRELYDASKTPPPAPAATLAGELLSFRQSHKEVPPQPAPTAALMSAVTERLKQLRST